MTRNGRWRWIAFFLIVLICASACGPSGKPSGPQIDDGAAEPTEAAPGWFRDMTAESGIDFTYRNGQEAGHLAILESLGGGVALIDYDRDGLLDIFVTGGGYYGGPDKKQILGHPNRLYKNLGNWKFKDVTAEVGLTQPLFYSHGCAVADYDRDGWPDLLVTGWGRVALFHNVKDDRAPGGRRFVDVTHEAGLDKDIIWTTSAAWADLDGDGYPDLYICQYVDWSFANHPSCHYHDPNLKDVCPPKKFNALPHKLFHNNGNGTFTDVSEQAGLYQKNATKESKGLGVIAVDLNDDGLPDIYVADDTTNNLLYLNRTKFRDRGPIVLEELGMERGVAKDDQGMANGSMGVTAGDYDGSGLPSLFVTNYENELHALYRNIGREFFTFQTQRAGIAAIGRGYVGFGTGFADVDNDGWEDLVIANGHVIRHPQAAPLRQRPVLFYNAAYPSSSEPAASATASSEPGASATGGPRGHRAERRFENRTVAGGPYFRTEHIGRGIAFGDLDNDGRVDMVISHLNEPVVVLRNECDAGNHWLGFELAAKDHRDMVGAKIILKAGDQTMTRFITGGGSYLSSSDQRRVFGLGKATKIDELDIYWPPDRDTGRRLDQHWVSRGGFDITSQFPIDRYHRLIEGEWLPQPPGNR